MRPGVVGDRMAVQDLTPGELGQAFGVAANFEESGADAFGGERVAEFSAYWSRRARRQR